MKVFTKSITEEELIIQNLIDYVGMKKINQD